MKRIDKIIIISMLLTMIATYADILWHQTDGMYGGEVKHTLPTTRLLVRALEHGEKVANSR